MSKELRSGISCNGDIASLAILEVKDDSVELRHLEEMKRARTDEYWFLSILDTADKKTLGKLSSLSIAIPADRTLLYTFPMDSSLTQVEMNEHVSWELSNFVSDYRANDYVSDIKLMRTNAREGVADVLAVTMQKSFVFELQKILKEMKITLGAIEIECFAAEEALVQSHPETRDKQCAVVGFSPERIDVGIGSGTRLMEYRHLPLNDPEDVMQFLREAAVEFAVTSLYAYGNSISYDWQKLLRREFGQKFMLLNPFRRMRISSTVPQFSSYNGNEYRFACAVGSALRRV